MHRVLIENDPGLMSIKEAKRFAESLEDPSKEFIPDNRVETYSINIDDDSDDEVGDDEFESFDDE